MLSRIEVQLQQKKNALSHALFFHIAPNAGPTLDSRVINYKYNGYEQRG